MKDYDKIQAEEQLIESLENGIQEYEKLYKDKIKDNKKEKTKLRKYLIPFIVLDILLLITSGYINLNFNVDGYIFASLYTLTCIPNVILLDKYRILLKNIISTKELEDSISYLKEKKELVEEKIDKLKYDKEPIYISEHAYVEDRTVGEKEATLTRKKR